MTREEAKEILTHNWTRVDNPNYSESELDEAVDMAIEALQNLSKPNKELIGSDIINRADAIEAVASADETDGTVKVFTGRQVNGILSALPSAEGGDAEVNETKSPYMQQSPNNGADLISRQDAIDAITTDGTRMERFGLTRITIVEAKQKAVDLLESLPSADITDTEECQKCQETTERVLLNARKPNRGELKFTLSDGTEIPIDEESYEIGYTHGQMADRPTGEWVRLEREENVYDLHGVPTWGINYMCDKCGFITTAIQDHFGQYKFCPNCGAKMGGNNHD